ncbi:TetR/AcrR family transcriptional regulator [Catelliglobosispora koreensis]|uniref:TetR/AcrR family transcriptional regulator n=1 Tax=Catelliglobosispora koreensis TaxID=129052 RepID=UPI00036E8B4B|nr:TetR/AcrR family transcriptional regulator [Catelliglobosispora koreensis]
MPKLWDETVDAHRHAVREAIIAAAWDLAAEHGLTAVTMSQIAQRAGIGRATLYKYFPDTQTILVAWHQQHLAAHLAQLTELSQRPGTPAQRLEAVLTGYAFISFHQAGHAPELVSTLHKGDHVAAVQRQLAGLVTKLLTAVSAESGGLRKDVPQGELAEFCLHALSAARSLKSQAAVHRLVGVTVSALRPQP